jgi:excisionase family DNA binding protein
MSLSSAPLLLTAEQAAAMLNVRVSWLRQATRDGRVPHVRFEGSRMVRYRADALASWVDENSRPGRVV